MYRPIYRPMHRSQPPIRYMIPAVYAPITFEEIVIVMHLSMSSQREGEAGKFLEVENLVTFDLTFLPGCREFDSNLLENVKIPP